MCTVTWTRFDGGYSLFFNRDELLVRKDALPPRVHDRDGTRFLAPVDGDFGGTWIAVNEYGLTIGVLNGYRSADSSGDFTSRGLLMMDLASAPSLPILKERLDSTEVSSFRSFRLLALAESGSMVAEWDLSELVIDPDADRRLPLISSSFDETEVGSRRRGEYRSAVGDEISEERLESYHRSHASGPSAYSVCMHRADAATRSFTKVVVSRNEVVLRYHPDSPCRASRDVSVGLARASDSPHPAKRSKSGRES